MRSTEVGAAAGGDEQNRPVWVQLDALCIRRPDGPASTLNTRHALDMTAQALGILHHWLRYGKGDWLGLVSYHVPFADGRKEQLYMERQLVPAYALRPASTRPHTGASSTARTHHGGADSTFLPAPKLLIGSVESSTMFQPVALSTL